MQKHFDEKIESNKLQIRYLQNENTKLEKQKNENAGEKGIEKWLGYVFESSSGLTQEFSDFARDYKRELKKAIPSRHIIGTWSRGHFCMSGFIKNMETEKIVYISTGDVRDGGHNTWYKNILIRTAEHEKDYMGGSNRWTTWPELKRAIARLTA